MQVGVNLLNFGPGVTPASLSRWAETAEELGYHSIMISDHITITPGVAQNYPEPFYDPFTTLSWLAGQTKRIKLGTTVIVLPYRSPMQVARLGANLDQLSGGRFIFGVGVGAIQSEFDTLGIPFNKRGAMTNDYLAAIKTLWTSDMAAYEGTFVSFADVAGMKPAQSPHPPIWIGGRSDAAIRRAIKFGDAWHPNRFTLEWLKSEGIPKVEELAKAEGLPVPALCPRIRMNIQETTYTGDARLPGQGTIEQMRNDLKELEAMGAEHVLLDWYSGDLEATKDHKSGLGILKTLADEVIDLPGEILR
jgi:probable F420-dependent oxidoreductase